MLLSSPASFPPAPLASRPVTLRLQPPPEAVRYEAVVQWENYANGAYHTSTVAKPVTLDVRPVASGGCTLDFRTGPPVLTKAEDEDLESLETLALRLAALYAWVVVDAAPTGRFEAVGNHDALCQTWEALAQALRDSTTVEDQITPTLIDFMGRQLEDPANVLRSLEHDYLYRTLVNDFYDQPLGQDRGPARRRGFSQFFGALPLWFSEQVTVVPGAAGDALALELRGTLDLQQTDVAAIGRLMADASPAADPHEAPHFHYAASYVLDPATGLPVTVNLTVYGRLAEHYNREYTLTLQRI